MPAVRPSGPHFHSVAASSSVKEEYSDFYGASVKEEPVSDSEDHVGVKEEISSSDLHRLYGVACANSDQINY